MTTRSNIYRELKAQAAPYSALEPQVIAEAIRDDMAKAHELQRNGDRTAETWRRLRPLERGITDKQRHLAWRFGELNGWHVTLSDFPLHVLARGMRHARSTRDMSRQYFMGNSQTLDHPYFYRVDGRAAAIAVHLYNAGSPGRCTPEETAAGESKLTRWAAAHGLTALFPDFPSWWYPGWTRLVVYVGPASPAIFEAEAAS